MTGSAACWARYGELLAAQYVSEERMSFHQLVVDSYAAQHPGDGEDPRAVRSVGIHLMTLCLFLERGADPALGTRLHKPMVERPVFHRLDAPAARGSVTALEVPLDGDPVVAREAAYRWAASAWEAWSDHHATVRTWVDGTPP